MNIQNLLFFDKKGTPYNFEWNGEYWEGRILFQKVSEKLFEVEHIFIVEKFLDNSLNVKYGYPHGDNNYQQVIWRTRWENDYDEGKDVSNIIYTYELGNDIELDFPVLINTKHVEIYLENNANDIIDQSTGLIITDTITPSSIQINIVLNSNEEGIYDRTLILEDYSDPNNPIIILKVEFHGEIEGEDSRLKVLLENFGRKFLNEDYFICRESDIQEAYPDFTVVNKKRKELLLEGEKIFPYIGSYKALFNAIKFFGYYDLKIKEYWLNIHKDESLILTPLQQNNKILKQLKKLNIKGHNSLELIDNLLQDENQGKYKHVEIYGKKKDGTFGLKKQYEQLFPSKSYKKTSLFGLFYNINDVDEKEQEDEFGYPIVHNVFLFSPEEVLIKLFGLKERLKRDYLPLNARIVDITGEGIYFNVYKTKGWVDQLNINDIKNGINVDISVYPEYGYIEDLRPFYLKKNLNGLLYPIIDEINTNISYYGNTIEPYTNSQHYSISDIPSLISAIKNFYDDIKNGKMPKYLGDGDYDPPGYKLFSTNEEYKFPAGFPVLLINNSFNLKLDDINRTWDSFNIDIITDNLTIASYNDTILPNPGIPLQEVIGTTTITLSNNYPQEIIINIGQGKDWFNPLPSYVLFVRIESLLDSSNVILGYVHNNYYDTSNGELKVICISKRGNENTISNWKIIPTNVFLNSYIYKYVRDIYKGGFYSWDRLPYIDFYEIEWKIWKNDERPYYFEIRGPLPELNILPHFLPYTGKYSIQCKLIDGLNNISIGIKKDIINVNKREIELKSITRFRKSEIYNFDNALLNIDSYPSQWLFPVENDEKNGGNVEYIQNFSEYSNNFNEGQDCEVLTKLPEVKATAQFDIGINKISIVDIKSTPIYSGSSIISYEQAIVTTTSPHNFSDGENVFIYDSNDILYGNFPITIINNTSFKIPYIQINPIIGGSVYGSGNIKLYVEGKEIVNCNLDGDLNSLCGLIYYKVNSSNLYPQYKVISITDSTLLGYKTIVIQAPNNTGSTWNNKQLEIQTTGSITVSSTNVLFSGGEDEREEYLYYDFNNIIPNEQIKYWGTKNLTWDTFSEVEIQNLYALTFDMFDYHNDWLGGFDLYSLQYGDRIRITKETDGIVFKKPDNSQNNTLTLSEAVKQLNESEDENIKRFDYKIRNYSMLPDYFNQDGSPIIPELTTDAGIENINFNFISIPNYSSSLKGMIWDKNGNMWIYGQDLIQFDGLNFNVYNHSNSPIQDIVSITNCIKVDKNNTKWIGLSNTFYPLISFNENDYSKNKAYHISEFIDSDGNNICPIDKASITSIEINSQTGDIFCAFESFVNPLDNSGLLYYNNSSKSWNLLNILNSNIASNNINDLKLEYYDLNKWYLWIATSEVNNNGGGLSRYNGINFKNYKQNNSGISSNNIYSIELDELNHKWIGTDNGIVYWDTERWFVWNNNTNSELSQGKIVDIKNIGHGNIWFSLQTLSSEGELYFFNGYNFNKILYREDNITLINPTVNIAVKNLIVAPWKIIRNDYVIYPENLLTLTSNGEICQIDYVIPHIHATSKFPGSYGWDFVYHDTSVPLPHIEYIHEAGDDSNKMWFTLNTGGFNENITLNTALIRPKMPHVDSNSWYKPIWQRFNIDYLKEQFPSLNINNIFLYAPLRDILKNKVAKEEYWRNNQIERISEKKSRNLLSTFEWIISLGSQDNDVGIKICSDNEGDIISVGNFKGDIFVGGVNNISSQNVYLHSPSYKGIYIVKYNKVGVLQWARTHMPTPITGDLKAQSVISDTYNNVYVLYSYEEQPHLKPSHIIISKWNSDGDLINTFNFVISDNQYINNPINFIGDIKIDKYQNIYLCGSFKGTLNINSRIIEANYLTGYIIKFDNVMNDIWIKTINSDNNDVYINEIIINENLYITGTFEGTLNLDDIKLIGKGKDIFISELDINNNIFVWGKSLSTSNDTVVLNSHLNIDSKNNILLTGSFYGELSLENKKINSPLYNFNIFIIKLSPTKKLIWMKNYGGDLFEYVSDIEKDNNDNIYITGHYSDEAHFDSITLSSRGMSDIYLCKLDKDGNIIDTITAGYYFNDRGGDLTLDKEENIYLTGYFMGNAEFKPYTINLPSGNLDVFIAKIPQRKFIPGYKIGLIQSWFGSHSWSWKEEKLYENEFEIPIGATVFINPINSLIPGKKNHTWTLTNAYSGEEIIKIRKTPYFIWTFVKPGSYTIHCELQDANGNVYETTHKGKIRVINHKEIKENDIKPEIVNNNDYNLRSIYSHLT